jgi:hypothetical protein
MRTKVTMVVAAFGSLALACASAPPPTQQLASAQSAVRAARDSGANQVPRAQLHQQLAEEQVTLATKLIDDGQNERATQVLQRANADAELAVWLTREANAKKQTEALETAATQPPTPTPTVQATNY